MIIVFAILLAFAGLKQEVSGSHLEDHAREGPHVGTAVVLGSNDDLGGPILARLYLRRKVMISPAAVAEVANLELQILAKLGSTLFRPVLLNLLFNLSRIQQLELEMGYSKHFGQFILRLTVRTITTSLVLLLKLVLDTDDL